MRAFQTLSLALDISVRLVRQRGASPVKLETEHICFLFARRAGAPNVKSDTGHICRRLFVRRAGAPNVKPGNEDDPVIAAHFVGHSSSHFCHQRWDFSCCSNLNGSIPFSLIGTRHICLRLVRRTGAPDVKLDTEHICVRPVRRTG